MSAIQIVGATVLVGFHDADYVGFSPFRNADAALRGIGLENWVADAVEERVAMTDGRAGESGDLRTILLGGLENVANGCAFGEGAAVEEAGRRGGEQGRDQEEDNGIAYLCGVLRCGSASGCVNRELGRES